jgi:hypothetical protein
MEKSFGKMALMLEDLPPPACIKNLKKAIKKNAERYKQLAY